MRKKITAALLSLILLSAIFSLGENKSGLQERSGDYAYLARNVIRLHILADGNDEISQDIKIKVRDALLEEFSGEFAEYETRDIARREIIKNTGRIKEFVDGYLREEGIMYGCSADVCRSEFPDRTYEDIYFPAGEYTALKISLGSGKGRNWWCVMYPPLCFAEIHEDEDISGEEVELRWKIVEWWEEFINKK